MKSVIGVIVQEEPCDDEDDELDDEGDTDMGYLRFCANSLEMNHNVPHLCLIVLLFFSSKVVLTLNQ